VPPQQADWYTESLFGTTSSAQGQASSKLPAEILTLLREKELAPKNVEMSRDAKLPEELLQMVREWVDSEEDGMKFPMSLEEAKDHRQELMAERNVIQVATETCWQQYTYNFCEH
jgi:polyhydroxyalkanoate synthesis regulator phasin